MILTARSPRGRAFFVPSLKPFAVLLTVLNCFHDFADQARSGSCLRSYYSRFAVRPFRYCGDPLFVACCALYAVNRWVIKPLVPIAFFLNWFSDFLLIQCALPPLLWLQYQFGLPYRAMPPTIR